MPANLEKISLDDETKTLIDEIRGPLVVEDEHWQSTTGNLMRWTATAPDMSQLSRKFAEVAIEKCGFVRHTLCVLVISLIMGRIQLLIHYRWRKADLVEEQLELVAIRCFV
jgi:hypothetical protein